MCGQNWIRGTENGIPFPNRKSIENCLPFVNDIQFNSIDKNARQNGSREAEKVKCWRFECCRAQIRLSFRNVFLVLSIVAKHATWTALPGIFIMMTTMTGTHTQPLAHTPHMCGIRIEWIYKYTSITVYGYYYYYDYSWRASINHPLFITMFHVLSTCRRVKCIIYFWLKLFHWKFYDYYCDVDVVLGPFCLPLSPSYELK